MARTKLVARVIQNQLRRANQRRPNPKRPRSGVKTIEGRIGNGDIKIKLIPQPKNIQDKKKSIGKLLDDVVRQDTIYTAERKNVKC